MGESLKKITGISPQKKNADRVNVYVDGEFCCGLTLEVVVKAGLRVGQGITDEDLSALGSDEEKARAMDRALGFLGHRARSEKEIRDRLLKFGYDEALVDLTLERLNRLGYVDDAAFAALFIRDRLNARPRGRRAILGELRRKGVAPEIAERVFDEVEADRPDDEKGRAVDLAIRWARTHGAGRSREERERAKRRLWSHLARRGFTSEAIRTAVSEALAA